MSSPEKMINVDNIEWRLGITENDDQIIYVTPEDLDAMLATESSPAIDKLMTDLKTGQVRIENKDNLEEESDTVWTESCTTLDPYESVEKHSGVFRRILNKIKSKKEYKETLKRLDSQKRLTNTAWANFDPWECCGQDSFCQRGCHDEGGCNNGCIVPKIYYRLAQYEDLADKMRGE